MYINSDGANWIRAAENYAGKSKLVADRFHLMKYINRVARYTPEENKTKGQFYRCIYKNQLPAAKELLEQIGNQSEESSHAVQECRTYLTGNWEYIQRAFHDRRVPGCSAEGHVSSVYSERMSSRPMGWSETGTDRMCRLRCFIRNYGREKVIDLVNYRREREMEAEGATGTDGMIEESQRRQYTAAQRETMRYAELLHGSLADGSAVRKILAIREQIGDI